MLGIPLPLSPLSSHLSLSLSPFADSLSPSQGLMSITYGCRSLVGVHVNGSIFSLRYFPWGRVYIISSFLSSSFLHSPLSLSLFPLFSLSRPSSFTTFSMQHFDLGSLAVLLDDKTFGITKFYTTFDPTHQQVSFLPLFIIFYLSSFSFSQF